MYQTGRSRYSSLGGRLFLHMLAAIAEFEHDLIVERTHDGLAAARAHGRSGGTAAGLVDSFV